MSLLAGFVLLAAQALEIHVDPRGGDDKGDGSVDRPFATIHRALALQALAPQRETVVRLGLGHFGADRGETLPILLPANVKIVGAGSKVCEVTGPIELPIFVLPASGTVSIESLVVRGGAVAFQATKSEGSDRKSTLDVSLVDVAVEECPLGIDLAAARGRLALRGDGLRMRATQKGLVAAGAAELALSLRRSLFAGGTDGIELTTEGAPEEGPSHALELIDCRFDGPEVAGLARRGKDGRNRAPRPWRIERCSFRGGRFGLLLELPGGDVPLEVVDCTFEECADVGLSSAGSGAGSGGEGARPTKLERCRFRWNAIGAQLHDVGGGVELADCRFEDSIGAGLSFASFGKAPLRLRAERCLLARNGAGVTGVCVAAERLDAELDRCTIADNARSGVQRARGPVSFRLSRCVVAGNRRDLDGLAEDATVDCFVGGDPGFVDRAGRDWRLQPGSPARAAGGAFE
jgi:hypothetical protein